MNNQRTYEFSVFRNPDNWRLRAWCIEMYCIDNGRQLVVDRRYMVGFGNITRRLERKIQRMKNRRSKVDGVLNLYNS